jgi:hypothetical protein
MPIHEQTGIPSFPKREAILIVLKSLETRLEKLEDGGRKSPFKKLTENAGAVALFLGLVLTFASLRDVFVTKPAADRIDAISQFNRAVNSAAQIRQELFEMQIRTTDPSIRLAILSSATPRILNEISTAKAILPALDDADVGIPQLISLISESYTAGDLPSVKEFVTRAVGKTDVSPYLRSEAKRYEGKYLFSTGEPWHGRQAFEEAVKLLGDSEWNTAARAYVLGDLLALEFSMGDCTLVEADVDRFAAILRSGTIPLDSRRQLAGSVLTQFQQLQGRHCPMPKNSSVLDVVS